MNITFDGAEKINAHTHSNVDKDTTIYRSSESTGKVQQNSFALDISGTVMDNSAYAGHGRTAEEVMQEAGQQDIVARRNYMAVMSNSMSDEDFAKLQEDGFHPGSTDIETVVTIVDHIKTALLKGGTRVAGYTDTMDDAQLKEITKSAAFASELKQAFAEHDIPLTPQNAQAVKMAYDKLEGIFEISEGAQKYMIENQLPPTVENLYTARFSASKDAGRQGRGYYQTGGVAGYMAKKPENIDYQKLMPQIEKTIQEAGYPLTEETVAQAKWLIDQGIPFCKDTLVQKHQLDGLVLPQTPEIFARTAAAAIADGAHPMKAELAGRQSYLQQAVEIQEQFEGVEESAVQIIAAKDLSFNLKNLIAAKDTLKQGADVAADEKRQAAVQDHMRLLNEVRLTMSVSANIRLLKKGYRIDLAPMEDLLLHLQKEQETYSKALFQESDTAAAIEKNHLFQQTVYAVESIRFAPIAIVSEIAKENTLQEVESYAAARKAQYQKAGERYETLMTAPRRDMGDSILKAFRNVDDILADLNQDASEENRRAVRILGYNSMEITKENFETVKEADGLLRRVAEGMKPAAVLSMIREGVNPLELSLEELEQYLNDAQPGPEQEIESFSRFLYSMEQKKGISEEERSAYIGIYRLLRQVEKGDDAAVGALLQTGARQSLSNLLTAVRSSKRKHMDYTVDEHFGGVDTVSRQLESITEQIEKGYIRNRQQMEEALRDEAVKEAEQEYDKMIFDEVRTVMGSEEAVLRQLMDYGQPITANNLLAAGEFLAGYGDLFRRLKKLSEEKQEPDVFEEADMPSKLTNQQEALHSYEEMADKLLKVLEDESFAGEYTALDIKAMSAAYKQITFMKSMAREENYEIPVEIEGDFTAIHLKMIHNHSGESKVSITFETQTLGKNAAEFSFIDDVLHGYGICDTPKISEILNTNKELFAFHLQKEGIKAGDIRFMEKTNLDLKEITLKAEKDRVMAQTPDLLYRAAKAYIGYIQEISK